MYDKEIVALEETNVHTIKKLASSITSFSSFVSDEHYIMGEIVRRTTLNAVREQATVFLVGKNYHARCRIDFDMYYTLVTVIGSE